MKIYNSKIIIFYIFIIFISLIFLGLVGAIIRLINIPAVLITVLLIGSLIYSKKIDWLHNILQSRFKTKVKRNALYWYNTHEKVAGQLVLLQKKIPVK